MATNGEARNITPHNPRKPFPAAIVLWCSTGGGFVAPFPRKGHQSSHPPVVAPVPVTLALAVHIAVTK